MGNVVQPLMFVTKAIGASVSFFDMIDSKKVKLDGLSEPEVNAFGDIELEDVTFAYPTRPNVKVLTNFSATIRSGKTTALVGPSGSGKSTIVGLLERWYDLGREEYDEADPISETKQHEESIRPDESRRSSGKIMLGGHEINSFDVKWWRSKIGLVQQEPFLFNDTIQNNVAFGLIGTKWEHTTTEKKMELVQEACKEAFADEFIQKLPQVRYHSLRLPALTVSGLFDPSW